MNVCLCSRPRVRWTVQIAHLWCFITAHQEVVEREPRGLGCHMGHVVDGVFEVGLQDEHAPY